MSLVLLMLLLVRLLLLVHVQGPHAVVGQRVRVERLGHLDGGQARVRVWRKVARRAGVRLVRARVLCYLSQYSSYILPPFIFWWTLQ